MYNGEITDTKVREGIGFAKKDSCQGDSGCPLKAANQRGGMIQLRIVSWGEECTEENRPGGYTRIAAVEQWIESELKQRVTRLLYNT